MKSVENRVWEDVSLAFLIDEISRMHH